MILRRALLACLGLWVGLGIVLAPARPMPGMEMGAAAPFAQTAAMGIMLQQGGHRNVQHKAADHKATGHSGAETVEPPSQGQHPSKPAPTEHDHFARCILCVVGAGMLTIIVTVVRASSPARAPTPKLRPFTQPKRFRHFQSRAPPAAFSS